MKKLTKEQLIEIANDPSKLAEFQKSTQTQGLDDILQAIEITDEDDVKSAGKKYQDQLAKVVKYFGTQLEETERSAVEKSGAGEKAKEAHKINEFHKNNPAMKNADVVAAMQPFYDGGKSLEDSLKMACRALELDPATGEAPKEQTAEEKAEAKRVADAAKAKEKTVAPVTSMRTDLSGDDEYDDPDDKKDEKPLSIEDSIDANMNAYIAEHGDPFAEDDK